MLKGKQKYAAWCIGGGLFIIDRIMKTFFIMRFAVCNTGVAFSIAIPGTILLIVNVFFILGILLWYIRTPYVKSALINRGMACLVGGAVSNMIDRLWYGCVVDYLYVFLDFIWFNIADIAIVCGGALIIMECFRKK